MRQLIWALTVRRAESKAPGSVDGTESERLKRRASVTAGLLCLVFAVFYVDYLFRS